MEPRLKISPPWVTYFNMLTALFDGDPDIAVSYDDEKRSITLTVSNGDKGAALQKVLPSAKKFGNVAVLVNVEGPISNRAFVSNEDLMNTLFEKNPAFSFCRRIEGIITSFTYVVFKNTVVQFFNDNLNDIYGNVSTLYQNIAEEVFADAKLVGVVYNTDVERKVGKPLGEWP